MMQKHSTMAITGLLVCLAARGQDSTSVSYSGYAEVYYVLDFARPPAHTRPLFVYSHNRTGEANLNLGFVKAAYASTRVRGNLALMAGTYSNANLANEPGVLRTVLEGNVGARVSKQHQVWVDAGIMPSHIGFESAVGKDNWTLTRSVAADNSPYFEAGVRVSYSSKNQQWFAAVFLLNGWQRIQRLSGSHTPSFGTQVTFKPTATVTLNSSTFIGSDQPDSLRRMRYFHNLYGIIQLSKLFGITMGLDAGLEQARKGSRSFNVWYAPVVIVRTRIAQQKTISVRAEYYSDPAGVIVSSSGLPFRVWGLSSNLDWDIAPNLLWRVEAKWLRGQTAVFQRHDGAYDRANWTAATAFCFSF
ncbi:porin [Flaviaesturariibacter terrae]